MMSEKSPKEHLEVHSEFAVSTITALKNSPLPVIYVGAATCGLAAGALETIAGFEESLKDNGIEAEIRKVGCLGHCYAEPLVIIQNPGFPPLLYQKIGAGEAGILVRSFLKDGSDPCYEYLIGALEADENFPTLMDYPRYLYENRVVMEHCGLIDPKEIDHYLAVGGYESLAAGLEKGGAWVLDEVKAANLRGRGGAGGDAAGQGVEDRPAHRLLAIVALGQLLEVAQVEVDLEVDAQAEQRADQHPADQVEVADGGGLE
jgi:NADH-quinone oxidoreductase subunit F